MPSSAPRPKRKPVPLSKLDTEWVETECTRLECAISRELERAVWWLFKNTLRSVQIGSTGNSRPLMLLVGRWRVAVGEARGGVVEDAGGVAEAEEFGRVGGVLGRDALGVTRTVRVDLDVSTDEARDVLCVLESQTPRGFVSRVRFGHDTMTFSRTRSICTLSREPRTLVYVYTLLSRTPTFKSHIINRELSVETLALTCATASATDPTTSTQHVRSPYLQTRRYRGCLSFSVHYGTFQVSDSSARSRVASLRDVSRSVPPPPEHAPSSPLSKPPV